MTPNTPAQAVAKALSTHTFGEGMCDAFSAYVYGFSASGYVSAAAHWAAVPAQYKHPGDTKPPLGAIAMFIGGSHGFGHAAPIVTDTADMHSTDMSPTGQYAPGQVNTVPLDAVRNWYPAGSPVALKYVGWIDPYFDGQLVTVLTKETPMTTTDMIDGNDESSYQSHVTPAAFHFDKASQGLKADPTYADKVKDALSRGELAGAYHYIDNSASILAQARFFVQTCGPRLGAPKAADYEQAGVTEAEQAEFVRTVQGLDTLNQVGTYESYGRYHPGQFVGDFLWVAAYDGKKEFILPNALFDQWNDKPEDEDIARFNSAADMFAWAHAKEPKGLPTRPALVLLAERNLAMQIGRRPIQSEWDRRARIGNNVLRGLPNTGIPGVASTPMPVHILQAIQALHDFIVKTPASDPWGHRARIAYNALNGIH